MMGTLGLEMNTGDLALEMEDEKSSTVYSNRNWNVGSDKSRRQVIIKHIDSSPSWILSRAEI